MSSITVGAVRNKFLLTRPMRDVTNNLIAVIGLPDVSTHTPHAGRDMPRKFARAELVKFLLTRPMRDVTCRF